jgi:predicted nucleotide-binding protein
MKGGHEVEQAYSVDAALDLLQRAPFRLVVADLRMPAGAHFNDFETEAGHKTGLALARRLVRDFPRMKVIVHTGGLDRETEARLADSDSIKLVYKSPDLKPLLRMVKQLLDADSHRLRPFIVHGHDHSALFALKDFLQNRMGFAEPIILAQMPSLGKTLLEKFENYAAKADLVFVLLTPDDVGSAAGSAKNARARARQNVMFELGYFLGYLRRQTGSVFVLHKGDTEIPTDLSGLVFIDITHGIDAAAEAIRRETRGYAGQGTPP